MDAILLYIKDLNPNILLGMAALTGTLFVLKGFIGGIFKAIQTSFNRVFMYNLDIHYSIDSYHKFNKWFYDNIHKGKFMRNYKIQQFGTSEHLLPGYGRSFFFLKGYPPIIVNRTKEEKKNIYVETDTIRITVLTPFKKTIRKLYDEIDAIQVHDDGDFVPYVYKYHDDYWNKTAPLRNVLKPSIQGSKDMVEDLEKFLSHKHLYNDKGIPFKRGYLLYGEPGTGKTSLILYIANKFKYNVYIVDKPLGEEALSEIKENSILLVEDIDLSMMGSATRKLPPPKTDELKKNKKMPKNGLKHVNGKFIEEAPKSEEATLTDMLGAESLRKMLNMLDGVYSYNNCLFVCTTNNKDVLDPALLRYGRIEKTISIGKVTPPEQLEFVNTFYDSAYTTIESTEDMTIAELAKILHINIANEEEAIKQLRITQ